MRPPAARIERQPAGERFRTTGAGIDSWHSFSFGAHFDPDNLRLGPLIANNDDRLTPGCGFETHPHRDTELLTWVLSGALWHRDSLGSDAVIKAGQLARTTAGRGIEHSEIAGAEPVHLVQMWIEPDERGVDPEFEVVRPDPSALRGVLVPVASGLDQHAGTTAARIHNRRAGLLATSLAAGESVTLPETRTVHLFIAFGTVDLDEYGPAGPGDALRLTSAGARRITATEASQLLVWQLE